ncbi:tRNA (adenosine(37)-N6)-threonylcarbamoyltransferase complex dimerization subunit type 1 TsaB [Qipengyuania sp.]|uniref:tRNA (adenosine(37)-N6)-threonylcarbamoyltransferase complex dimerization subunit type 1 TsaB n=1 Tax=Qipengyuania sp. TaxID=2004515 RepID=UPI0035C7CFAE
MRLLAVETATEACSLALFEAGELLDHRHVELGRGHAERLIPLIAELPGRGRADEIRVSLGPGSFTGVRIGLAAARALGLAWQAKVVGFPTLALVAATAIRERQEPVTVCMNGGHGEYFIQNFSADGMAESTVQSLAPEQALQAVDHDLVAGNRAEALANLSEDGLRFLNILPDATAVAGLHRDHFTQWLSPIYGRGPDAKLPQ